VADKRVILDQASVPGFPRGVKFRFNKTKEQWVIMAPERLLEPNEVAVEVLKLCDGAASISTISNSLAEKFQAPVETILSDVTEMLQDLADKGFLIA
jgi:pyrroloquinoline quinone biosynthesis protein D